MAEGLVRRRFSRFDFVTITTVLQYPVYSSYPVVVCSVSKRDAFVTQTDVLKNVASNIAGVS